MEKKDMNIESNLEYFKSCIELVRSSYEFSPKFIEALTNHSEDLSLVIKFIPGQDELNTLYYKSFDHSHNVPIYGRFGRIFPSYLLRNDKGTLTKIHLGDLKDEEKAKTHISLTRVSYDMKLKDDNNNYFRRNPERTIEVNGVKHKISYRVEGFYINLRLNANYKTILLEWPKRLEHSSKIDTIEGYEIYERGEQPIFTTHRLPNSNHGDYKVHNNNVSNDEYAKHSFFLPNVLPDGTFDKVDNLVDVLKNELLSVPLAQDGLMSLPETIKLMYLQMLANLYMPLCVGAAKYQEDPDPGNKPLLEIGEDFANNFKLEIPEGYEINFDSPYEVLDNNLSTTDNEKYLKDPSEDYSKEKGLTVKGSLLEFQGEPWVVAKTEYNPNEQFFITCDISVKVSIEHVVSF